MFDLELRVHPTPENIGKSNDIKATDWHIAAMNDFER